MGAVTGQRGEPALSSPLSTFGSSNLIATYRVSYSTTKSKIITPSILNPYMTRPMCTSGHFSQPHASDVTLEAQLGTSKRLFTVGPDKANIYSFCRHSAWSAEMALEWVVRSMPREYETHNSYLVAYFTEESLEHLQSVDDLPHLASLPVPEGRYKSARSAKGRAEHAFNTDDPQETRMEYISYTPKGTNSPTPSLSPLKESHYSPQRHGREPPYPPYPLAPTSLASPHTPTLICSPERPRRVRPGTENLAPLVYLQAVSPPRRYPEDEKTLKLLGSGPRAHNFM